MGTIQHNAIIITGGEWNDHLDKAYTKAEELGLNVSPISKPVTNGYQSFAVFPDGSKEGWDESKAHEQGRKELIEWMEPLELDFVHVSYGEIGTYVLNTTGMDPNLPHQRKRKSKKDLKDERIRI